MALNKTTLAQQIYDLLREDILQQRIPCGAKLTLKALQQRFEVSSTPVREALTRLVQEQLVTYYSNIGVSVVSLDDSDIREIYQLMGDFDALAIQYSADHPEKEELILKLRESLQRCTDSTPGSSEWIRSSDEFHLLFYQYCRNSRLVSSAEKLRSQLSILAYQYEQEPSVDVFILEEHQKILEAYASGQTDQAAASMRLHLAHSMEYALKQYQLTSEKEKE